MSYIQQFFNEETQEYELNEMGMADPLDFIHTVVLGHCGCGSPEDSLGYIRNVLEWLNEKPSSIGRSRDEWSELFGVWWEKKTTLFHSDGIFYFTLYSLEVLDLEEHGLSLIHI